MTRPTHGPHQGRSTASVTELATRRLPQQSVSRGLYDRELRALALVYCRFAADAEAARSRGEADIGARLLTAVEQVRACIEETCLLDDLQNAEPVCIPPGGRATRSS
jgi:hypothetical protein